MIVGLGIFFGNIAVWALTTSVTWKIIAAVISVIAIFIPFEGYEKKECEREIDLIKLNRENCKDCYVYPKGKKAIYAYDNSGEYNLSGEAYEEDYVRGKIKIYESDECTDPILKIMKHKPDRNLTSIALFATRTEYVFFIPTGTVAGKNKQQGDEKINVLY